MKLLAIFKIALGIGEQLNLAASRNLIQGGL